MKIFFSVGEPSGDLHGANLIRELRRVSPEIICTGYGGPRMQAAGLKLQADLTKFAVMWLWRVILNLHHFISLLSQASKYFDEHRPDAVVLIDYPGFNWLIARSAKKRGIPVFYYGVPQIWAWAGWRIKKMRRRVDYALCKLPFEADWFRERGCHATYVGHPYFDEVHSRELDRAFVDAVRADGRLVTILPGSRTQEVIGNLPSFLKAAERIHQQVPTAKFAIAAFNDVQAALAREILGDTKLPVKIYVGRTPELIDAAHCCVACSGSVSLELLFHEKPTVIQYRVSSAALFVQQFFRKVKYITLVNLLATEDRFPKKVTVYDPDDPQAEQVPFPEYLTSTDKSDRIAAHIAEWLTDPMAYQLRVVPLRLLKQKYAVPGASSTAAKFILEKIQPAKAPSRTPIPAPHFPGRSAA